MRACTYPRTACLRSLACCVFCVVVVCFVVAFEAPTLHSSKHCWDDRYACSFRIAVFCFCSFFFLIWSGTSREVLEQRKTLAMYGERKGLAHEKQTRQRPRPAHGACDEAACSPTPNCRTRSLQYPDPLLLRSLSLISSCRGPGGPQLDDMSRKHQTAAATACTWRVRRGRMLADDELRDTQTAVPRPADGAQPPTASHSGWGSTRTESSRRGGFG